MVVFEGRIARTEVAEMPFLNCPKCGEEMQATGDITSLKWICAKCGPMETGLEKFILAFEGENTCNVCGREFEERDKSSLRALPDPTRGEGKLFFCEECWGKIPEEAKSYSGRMKAIEEQRRIKTAAPERRPKQEETKPIPPEMETDFSNLTDEELHAEITKEMKQIKLREAGTGIDNFLTTITGSPMERITASLLKAIVDQNKILIRQNELLLRQLRKMDKGDKLCKMD